MKMVSKPSKSSKSNGNKKNIASNNDKEEKNKEDRSVLRQPMDIGIRDVRDLIKALAGGTQEFQNILLNECTIIYECKICRNLFRSLANFISHKRVYCINTFNYFTHGFSEQQTERKPEIVRENEIVEPEPPQNNPQIDSQNENWITSDKTVENATETEDNTCVVVPQIKTEPYRITRKKDIAKIVDGLSRKGGKEIVKTSADLPESTYYSDIAERVMMRRAAKEKSVIELENVSDTCNGVFQTVKQSINDANTESIRVQLDELSRVVSKNQAVLQENGKFTVSREISDHIKNVGQHKCSVCDAEFITLQTLNKHVSMYHTKSTCFPCPLCKVFFPTPISVYRHLTKSHHRNETQIRRLRSQIFSKASERKLIQSPTKTVPNVNGDSKTLEMEKDQWINNFEGALRCGSCRKSFNRRAVLSVHLASCKERLAEQIPAKPVQTTVQQPQKPKAAVKPTSLLKLTSPPKLTPKVRNKDNPIAKSGIIVRKDYCKKVTSSNNSISSPSTTNCFYPNDSFSKLQVVVKKLEQVELQKNTNGSVPVKKKKKELKKNEKAKHLKVEKSKTKKTVRNIKKESEPEKEIRSNGNYEKNGSSTPDEASIKSERLSPVESVSSTVSSNRTNPYKLRKKKNKSDDNGSTETEITSTEEASNNQDDLVVNNENSKDDSNIGKKEGGHSVEKSESVLRRTKRARTLVKNKEFVYNNVNNRISPTANKCRAKSIKKAVKHLNYNGSMLLLQKNLNILKNNGDSKLIKFFPRIL